MADRDSIEDTDGREFLMILSEKSTVGILRYLSTHDKGHYSDFNLPVSVSTLNARLRELLGLNLINHVLERKPIRRESYVITEKGRKTLEHLEALITLNKQSYNHTTTNSRSHRPETPTWWQLCRE